MSEGRRTVSFAGCSVSIACEDPESTQLVDWLFDQLESDPALPRRARFRLGYDARAAEFALFRDRVLEYRGPCRGTAAAMLLDRVVHELAEGERDGLLLHAGCVARCGRALLIPGASGAGKTTLTAWLAARGFDYLSDELIFLANGATRVEALRRPLNVKRPIPAAMEALLASGDSRTIALTPDGFLASPRLFPGASHAAEIDAIVFPAYRPGAALDMVPVSAARTAMLLLGSLVNARRLPECGVEEASRVARRVPACALTWGDLDQISDRVERWSRREGRASGRDCAPR